MKGAISAAGKNWISSMRKNVRWLVLVIEVGSEDMDEPDKSW